MHCAYFAPASSLRILHVSPHAGPRWKFPPDLLLFIAIGFAAQLVDGALGMAFGFTAFTLLLGTAVPPAISSATVHAAECFTTGASATSHHAFGNIDRVLFKLASLPGDA